MRSTRIVAVAFVVACAVLAARIAAPSSGGYFRYSAALACGVERWKVKTLQDRPRLLRAHSIPIAQLVSHERPTPLPATRLPFERHIFSVDAAVTLVRHEADEDFHLVLQSGANHMIAESPSSACASGRRRIGAADAGGTEQVAALLASARRRGSRSSISSMARRASPRTQSSCNRSSACLLVELARRRTHAQVQAQRSRMGRCRLSPAFSHEQPPLARVAFRTSAPRIERARTKRRR